MIQGEQGKRITSLGLPIGSHQNYTYAGINDNKEYYWVIKVVKGITYLQ